jgi:formylglycine-generating enzyme required for sulfatase activity
MHRAAALATLVLAIPALAGEPDANGYTWVTIDHAGNRATNDEEMPITPGVRLGAVDYEFRMATTEVTVAQWHEFVRAYAPISIANGNGYINPPFTGAGIIHRSNGSVEIRAGYSPNLAAEMSWEYAARYCNWLHNGQVNEPWAFESGAYDTSTFTFNPDGSANHQATRTPGARYWIPSRDEWTKAAYYDPDRYGPGEEGYWRYPNRSNTRSINSLLPKEGGQANTSLDWDGWPLDVAQFDTTPYFALYDLDGGVEEFTDTVFTGGLNNNTQRYSMSNHWADVFQPDDPFAVFFDRIEYQSSRYLTQSSNLEGFRLAAALPCHADLAPPTGILNAADVTAFIDRYLSADPAADLAEPLGVINFFDIARFMNHYNAGCPGSP